MIGSTLLHYTVDAQLGQGGMGTVYRARDTLLNRTVALKVLTAESDDAMQRLLHEARSAAAFNHPNSVAIYGVEQHGSTSFIVMEHVEGASLDRVIPPDGLPIERAIQFACDISEAIGEAHDRGIVHRDIKPGNVMVTPTGHVKVLDFGIARRTSLPDEATRAVTAGATFSHPGTVVGTIGYLAPEQITGAPSGPRSDVFALGAVIFQMITGQPPFRGGTAWAILDATLRHEPALTNTLKPGTPPRLGQLVGRCLAKDPIQRFASAREVHEELLKVRQQHVEAVARRPSPMRRFAVVGVIGLLVAAAVGFALFQVRESRGRWARDTAIPEINRLISEGDLAGAYRLAIQARSAAPDDPQIETTWTGFTRPMPLTSNPPGAAVALRAVSGQDAGWIPLGVTPTDIRVPFGQLRWQFSLAGYETLEIVPNPFPGSVQLTPVGKAPPGMVFVPAGEFVNERRQTSIKLPEYWIDRFEVTNRQFKQFVDGGGYQKREYWPEPFRKGGRTLTWDEAMAEFRDTTGRTGPSTWELGTYPEGEADFPVHGVSWHEAAAYAAFVGKSLPTTYHWYRASGAVGIFSEVLQVSNFGGRGPAKVGASGSLGPFGTHDMAGNVKEWTWNESSEDHRFVLGGAWFEAAYQFHDEDARSAFERGRGFGFRCIQQPSSMDAALKNPIVTFARDVSELKPVGDEIFEAYRRLYDYDARPLDARIDEQDESHATRIVQRVSLTAAYGEERLPLIVVLPRNTKPPYQSVVYFPGSDAVRATTSREPYILQWLDFIVRSGRAAAFPIYQQTYERRRDQRGPNFLREISIQRGQDVRRTIDYLESRPDFDRAGIAFYGLSLGAQLGPVYLAIEPRFKTGVLLSGGFETWTVPPETDPVNFAPRVKQPVLMVNGREDFDLPYETAQIPMFKMLGSAATDKRHTVLEGGHIPPRPQEVYKEVLDWLDRYLGPVTR